MSVTVQPRQPAGAPTGGQFATSTRTEADVALAATGQVTHEPASPRVIATVRLQEWENDQAFEVGDPLEIDVTDIVAGLTPQQRTALKDGSDGSDLLYEEAARRGLCPDHAGPFEVHVEASLRRYDEAVATKRLTSLATELSVDPVDLDDAVRDVTDQMASGLVNESGGDIEDAQDQHYGEMDAYAAGINNGGLHSQVSFLVEQLGPERTEAILQQTAGR